MLKYKLKIFLCSLPPFFSFFYESLLAESLTSCRTYYKQLLYLFISHWRLSVSMCLIAAVVYSACPNRPQFFWRNVAGAMSCMHCDHARTSSMSSALRERDVYARPSSNRSALDLCRWGYLKNAHTQLFLQVFLHSSNFYRWRVRDEQSSSQF